VGEKNKVEVTIDYITSQGDKDLLTASAEAQARAGHDIMSHRAWQIQVHRAVLEPLDDVVNALIAKAGPISPVSEYLAKADGKWFGLPTTVGSQVKPCCSRLDLYKQHCGIDLTAIFPPNPNRDPKLVDSWNWDLYLKSAEQLFKAGVPVGLPMGQTSDAIDSTGAMFRAFGSVMVDEKDNIKVDSNETRVALEYFKKLMPFNPPEVYAWDDAGNNRWLISGKGAGIMNLPSAWAVAKRDNPKVAEQCWTHDMPRPRWAFRRPAPLLLWPVVISPRTSRRGSAPQFLSEKDQSRPAGGGLGRVRSAVVQELLRFRDLEDCRASARHRLQLPPRGDEQPSITGYPARPGCGVADLQPVDPHHHGRQGLPGQRADRQGDRLGERRAGGLLRA
jgi:hypothetical protein